MLNAVMCKNLKILHRRFLLKLLNLFNLSNLERTELADHHFLLGFSLLPEIRLLIITEKIVQKQNHT